MFWLAWRLSPLSASAAVWLDAKELHHTLRAFLVHTQGDGKPAVSVARMLPQKFLHRAFQCPILLRLLPSVVQAGPGNAELLRKFPLVYFVHDQLFFWACESFTVSSPTSSMSILFSFLRCDSSRSVGMEETPLAI